MQDKEKWLMLIDLFLEKRKHVDGLKSDFNFSLDDLRCSVDREELLKMLGVICRDDVADGFTENDDNTITIHECTTKKLEQYLLETKLCKNTKHKALSVIPTPPETTWEDLKIKFDNPYTISIYVCNRIIERKTNEELGFVRSGTKDKKPDRLWNFLLGLSIIMSNPAHDRSTLDLLCEYLKCKADSCGKTKSDVSLALKNIFCLKGNPFEKGPCRPKFKLSAPEDLKRGEIYSLRGIIREEPTDIMDGSKEEMGI